jgi:hypothetical protein
MFVSRDSEEKSESWRREAQATICGFTCWADFCFAGAR